MLNDFNLLRFRLLKFYLYLLLFLNNLLLLILNLQLLFYYLLFNNMKLSILLKLAGLIHLTSLYYFENPLKVELVIRELWKFLVKYIHS